MIKELADKAQIQFDNSKSYYTGIVQDREEALKYYMKQPMGNESKGFSKFITSDVRDSVDWAVCQLMEMFYTGSAPVRFNPMNEKDVDQANLETKYCQHIIQEENAGFELFNTWFKDALICKNGVVKAYWEEKTDEVPENYERIGIGELMQLLNQHDYRIQVVHITGQFEGIYTPEQLGELFMTFGENAIPMMASETFKVLGIRTEDSSRLCIENVPIEYFMTSQNQTTLDLTNTDYCGHLHYYSKNELLSMGYPYEKVMDLPTSNAIIDTSDSAVRYVKESGRIFQGSSSTKSAEIVEVIEHYIRDAQDDNPKLYMIKTASNGTVILDAYEVDRVPYHVITPKINPYRFYGDSLADEIIDLQYARSNLWRSAFDNIKYTVSPRKIVRGDVDREALNNYVPTGIIDAGADGSVENETTPFVAASAIEMAKELENARAERTGFSKETAGLDASALSNSTNMVGSAILNLSQLRVKMIASTFAHTGVKSLYNHVRELMLKNERRQKMFEINGKFVEINPRGWLRSRSSSVKTGLGHAGRMEMANNMQAILALQEKLVTAQGGMNGALVDADNIYNAITRSLESAGIVETSAFFKNPEGYQPPPPQPTPAELQIESYERVEKYKADSKANTEMRKIDADVIVEEYKVDKDAEMKKEELIYKYQESLSNSNKEKLNYIAQNNLKSKDLDSKERIERMKYAKTLKDLEPEKEEGDDKEEKLQKEALLEGVLSIGESLKGIKETAGKFVDASNQKMDAIQMSVKELGNKKKVKRLIKDKDGKVIGAEEI